MGRPEEKRESFVWSGARRLTSEKKEGGREERGTAGAGLRMVKQPAFFAALILSTVTAAGTSSWNSA